eukprot:6927279-Prymnesium_polylepis.1
MELVHAVPVILIARGAHVQQAHEVVPELVLDPPVSRPHVEIHLPHHEKALRYQLWLVRACANGRGCTSFHRLQKSKPCNSPLAT